MYEYKGVYILNWKKKLQFIAKHTGSKQYVNYTA